MVTEQKWAGEMTFGALEEAFRVAMRKEREHVTVYERMKKEQEGNMDDDATYQQLSFYDMMTPERAAELTETERMLIEWFLEDDPIENTLTNHTKWNRRYNKLDSMGLNPYAYAEVTS